MAVPSPGGEGQGENSPKRNFAPCAPRTWERRRPGGELLEPAGATPAFPGGGASNGSFNHTPENLNS